MDGLLEKDGETLKWGEFYHIFKKSNFSSKAEDLDELQAFRNIRKSRIFTVSSPPTIFPYTYSISSILKNNYISRRYVYNARKEPIASFRPDFYPISFKLRREVKDWMVNS